jgi:hypothetical protein
MGFFLMAVVDLMKKGRGVRWFVGKRENQNKRKKSQSP